MTEAGARMNRRWLYIPFAVAGVILLAYFLLWRAGATEMKKAIHVWAENQRAAGMEVSYDALKADGFPFFLRVHVETPEIGAPGEWHWRTDRLTLDALPYDLTRLIFSVRSEQFLSLAGNGDWRIRAEDFRASIANDKTRDWVFSVTLGEATAMRAGDGASADIRSLVFDLSPQPDDKTALLLSLAASDFELFAGEQAFNLNALQTVLAVTKTNALSDAAMWRNQGGTLAISGLIAELDESKLSVAGQLSLDQSHYPAGRLDTEIVSPAPLARAFGRAGIMTADEAESAAAALTLTAIASGGKIIAPIELKDGKAQIAGVKIADLPKFD